MQTHFCRTANKPTSRITFVAASLVYQAVPAGRLVGIEELVEKVRAWCARENERTPDPREITAAIKWLVDEGLLKEIHGHALAKLVR